MAQTIHRKGTGVRRQAKSQGRQGQVRKAKAHTNSIFDRMMNALPFTEEQWHKFFTVLILAVLLAIVVVIARVSGLAELAERQFAHAAANAGYVVRHVDVRGTDRLNEARVYEKAMAQDDLSMVLVDLEALRADLQTLNWVADARVARQLPNRLVIDIVEREPHAVLRRGERLFLIDPTGVELEDTSAAVAEEYMVISGEGAQGEVEALTRLLDASPALQPQVVAAEWIGNRRWNLSFASGQLLFLPEGAERAAAALISFAQAEGVHRLIGGEVTRFDMRNAPRMYMQVPGRADSELQMEDAE